MYFNKVILKSILICSILISMDYSIAQGNYFNLSQLDFGYSVKSETYFNNETLKPDDVFSVKNKTYLRFENINHISELPLIYIEKNQREINKNMLWKWEKPFIVIDGMPESIEIVDPKTEEILYTVDEKRNYVPDISSSPNVIPSDFIGSFISLTGGVAAIDNSDPEAATFGINYGFNSVISDRWFLGLSVGYNNQSAITTRDDVNDLKTSDFSLNFQGTYLFESGFNLFGKVGSALVFSEYHDNNNKSHNDKSLAPKLGIGVGYQMPIGLGVFAEINHLFSTSSVHNENNYRLGVSYIL